jgi:hypothetical protein
MPRFSRIIAVLLVALVAATALCGQVIHMAQPAHPGPAPCHGYSPAPPSPQPVNYQCCLTRHYSALLQSSIFPRPSWTNLYHGCEIASGSSLLPIAHCPLPILSALSSSPPRTVSLRI